MVAVGAVAPQMGTASPMPVGMMPVVAQQPSQPSDAIQKAMEATLASIALPPPNVMEMTSARWVGLSLGTLYQGGKLE